MSELTPEAKAMLRQHATSSDSVLGDPRLIVTKEELIALLDENERLATEFQKHMNDCCDTKGCWRE